MDAKWLKTQFELYPEKTKADLARFLSLDAPAISKILNNNRQIKAAEYVAMRKFFGYSVQTDHSATDDQMYRLKPLEGLKDSGSGNGQGSGSDNAWIMPANLLKQKTQTPPEQIKIFSVEDNAMAPDFMRGEQVLVDISNQKPSPPGAFVISDGVSFIIRRCEIVPQSNPLNVKVSSGAKQNDQYQTPLTNLQIIGRVIAKLEWL